MKNFKFLAVLMTILVCGSNLKAQNIEIRSDASWKATTTFQANLDWTQTYYNDGAWSGSVSTPFVAGAGCVSCGTNCGNAMWTDTSKVETTNGIGANNDNPVYFRKRFCLASDCNVANVTASFNADDSAYLYINGTLVTPVKLSGTNLALTSAQLGYLLHSGDNEIAIMAKNTTTPCWWVYLDLNITVATGTTPIGSSCTTANVVPKINPSNTSSLTCSQIFDNATTVAIANTSPSFYKTNTGSVATASRLFVDMASQGGDAGLMISGNTSSSNWPTMGFSLNNGTKTILGSSIISAITNSTATTESMDMIFSTKPASPANTAIQERVRILSTGEVGIGTATPGFKLDVNGGVRGTSAYVTSDGTLKTNVQAITNALDKVKALNGKSYFWNDKAKQEKGADDLKQLGFIAQELQKVLPEVVIQDSKGEYAVNYNAIIPVLAEAIKELDAKTAANTQLQDDLAKTKADLTGQITALQNQLNDICNSGCAGLRGAGTGDANTAPGNVLMQNVPNPFSGQTMIGYVLNTGTTAYMNINGLDGKQIKRVDISVKGQGSVTIDASSLSAGTYTYSLYVDDKVIDTKLMVISASK